jgi:hypothetical protein
MAPKSTPSPAAVTAAPAPSPKPIADGAAKRKHRKHYSLCGGGAISKMLKSLTNLPEGTHITAEGKAAMGGILSKLLDDLMQRLKHNKAEHKRVTVTPTDCMNAVRGITHGELEKHAVAEINKALQRVGEFDRVQRKKLTSKQNTAASRALNVKTKKAAGPPGSAAKV